MKVIYIAGPFNGGNAWEVEKNIRKAEELSLQVWEMGAAAICPHTNTRHFHGVLRSEEWLNGYLEILRRCDAVLTVPTWQSSPGARAEIARAGDLGIPVFDTAARLKIWVRGSMQPRNY